MQLSVPAPSIHIGIESNDFDLTDQKASNCALPCYFAACGIAPPYPPDPMGTYRPCAQARLATSGTGDTVQLQLLDSTGSAVFSTTAKTDSAGDSLNYIQLPLYSAAKLYGTPFTLLPPGNYKLVGELLAAGSTTASSSIDVRVR